MKGIGIGLGVRIGIGIGVGVGIGIGVGVGTNVFGIPTTFLSFFTNRFRDCVEMLLD